MKAWVLISLFATLASAQSVGCFGFPVFIVDTHRRVKASSSSSAASPEASSYIPDGISSGCKDFLSSLDSDSSLTSCTDSLLKSTANFGSDGSHTKAEVTGAIDAVCNGPVSSACPDSLIRGKLADFYSACSAELTSNPNKQVRGLYDVLYILMPMKSAICSKDDSGNYCVFSGTGANSTANLPAATDNGLDLSTLGSSNLAFLFRTANMDSTSLCTTCTRNIMSGYFSYESDTLYSPGISNSEMLGGQTPLVSAIEKQCGANFLSGAVQAAGGIQSGFGSSGAAQDKVSGVVVALVGALTVAISAL